MQKDLKKISTSVQKLEPAEWTLLVQILSFFNKTSYEDKDDGTPDTAFRIDINSDNYEEPMKDCLPRARDKSKSPRQRRLGDLKKMVKNIRKDIVIDIGKQLPEKIGIDHRIDFK